MGKKIENVRLKVVGVTFNNEDGTSRQEIISKVKKNTMIILVREPHNRHDKNAIAVFINDSSKPLNFSFKQIGYLGKQYATILAPIMDAGKRLSAKVINVDKYEGTWYCHIRIDEE